MSAAVQAACAWRNFSVHESHDRHGRGGVCSSHHHIILSSTTTMSALVGKDVYLVIGGSGFVGRHIVQALLARGDAVSVFDIVQRYDDTPFYSGDIAEEGSIATALQKVRLCVSMRVGLPG